VVPPQRRVARVRAKRSSERSERRGGTAESPLGERLRDAEGNTILIAEFMAERGLL